MLVTFKSKAAADVLMLDRHAQKALAPFGKCTAIGYFSVGELDNVIGVLEATTAEGKHHGATGTTSSRSRARPRWQIGRAHV